MFPEKISFYAFGIYPKKKLDFQFIQIFGLGLKLQVKEPFVILIGLTVL